MKRFLLFLMVCFIANSCTDSLSSSKLEGEWGMVSGGIQDNSGFRSLEKKGEYYKTMEFMSDGTFVEKCGSLTATGTYAVKGGRSISYSYVDTPSGGPEYFVVHKSGTWMYQFWDEGSFTLYDYASSSHEVSMTFSRIR